MLMLNLSEIDKISLFTLVSNLIIFSTASTVACVPPLLEPGEKPLFWGYVLFNRIPKKLYGATFVGRVKIIDIINSSVYMRAEVIKSPTHPA